MKVLAPTEDPGVVFRPSGHPVRWFVGVLSTLAIMLCVTWYAGLGTARVTVTVDDLTNEPGPNGEDYGPINGYDLAVVNNGPLAVEVVGAGLSGAPTRPISPVRLGPGNRGMVHVPLKPGSCADRLLRAEVRSAAGIVRSIDVSGLRLSGMCPA